MLSKHIGPVKQAWYRWKALRLPWRKRFLVGFDLQGNTYWEFRLTRGAEDSSERWRRIVSYPRSTYLSQVKVSPQWHQWLRYTRLEPPTMAEQQSEVIRQAKMKYLAAEADARWEAKPKVMEDPNSNPVSNVAAQTLPPLDTGDVKSSQQQQQQQQDGSVKTQEHTETIAADDKAEDANDPWAKAKAQGPGENWQPTAWKPTPSKK